jgi:outer membrane protein assembly factor BamA
VTRIAIIAALLIAMAGPGRLAMAQDEEPTEAPRIPKPAELEAAGAVIGEVIFDKQNVFDLTKPGENNALYRLANRWHMVTRDSVIRNQLLFAPGDVYSKRVLEESERVLRQNAFFYDAKIEPVRYENGVVDIRVWTRDLWTLMPGISVSRSGGENRTRLSLSERNLLGRGSSVRINYVDNVDREETSFQYFDRNLGRTWTSLFFELADASDGDTTDVRVIRPFFELDARWSAGGTFFDERREERFYDLGNEAAEYAHDRELHRAFYGWSKGLRDGWVRRWTTGVVYDDNQFSPVIDATLPTLLPEDRTLVYPFLGFELLEDRFESTSNRDQIERTEDFFLGTRFTATLGYASEDFGADRESVIYRMGMSLGFGSMSKKALLLSGLLSGRVDDGSSANQALTINARYYNQISDKRLFFMTLEGTAGNNLDLDNLVELGGDNGLRGYPLRYQTGDSKLLFTIEQRYFTDWYPFRLFRVGGAVFGDIGRVWGDNPTGGQQFDWLKDVGVGLRLAPTRASGRDVIHIDIAFPLDGDPSIDNVQFLIESKRSF